MNLSFIFETVFGQTQGVPRGPPVRGGGGALRIKTCTVGIVYMYRAFVAGVPNTIARIYFYYYVVQF